MNINYKIYFLKFEYLLSYNTGDAVLQMLI